MAIAWLSRGALVVAVVLMLGRARGASGDDVPPPRPAGGGDGAPPCPEPNPLLKSESLGDGGRAEIGRNALCARSHRPML